MSTSCSFRITRTAEDLAQTITALSQRLVKLEQRLESIESRVSNVDNNQSQEEVQILDGVENLLRECQELLETSAQSNDSENMWNGEEKEDENLAA